MGEVELGRLHYIVTEALHPIRWWKRRYSWRDGLRALDGIMKEYQSRIASLQAELKQARDEGIQSTIDLHACEGDVASLQAEVGRLVQFKRDVYAAYTPKKHCDMIALERLLSKEGEP